MDCIKRSRCTLASTEAAEIEGTSRSPPLMALTLQGSRGAWMPSTRTDAGCGSSQAKWHRRALRAYYLRLRYILLRIFSIRHWYEVVNIYEGLKLFLRLRT